MAAAGYRYIAGIDEAGRGALAGPVVAAAVILPLELDTPWLEQVKDSKLLTPLQRETLFPEIETAAMAIGIGQSNNRTIDSRGIAKATRLAMKSAVQQLSPAADALLIDYFCLPEMKLPQKGVIEGDSVCLSIACASIIAKVFRDRLMVEFDRKHAGYAFAQHKGYGTPEHLDCLARLGPCPIHRRSFAPVSQLRLM